MQLLGTVFNPLPNHEVLDMTKFKAFFLRIVKSHDYVDITKFKASAGDKSNVAKMTISLFDRMENSVFQSLLPWDR